MFPGKIDLVEASVLAGMLIKYEEDFILYSKIGAALGLVPNIDLPKIAAFNNDLVTT